MICTLSNYIKPWEIETPLSSFNVELDRTMIYIFVSLFHISSAAVTLNCYFKFYKAIFVNLNADLIQELSAGLSL